MKNNRSAFSLIELAIVLIIVGLLIAGILGGAKLINNAQLRSIISEARNYQTAVSTFYLEYASVPGDYNGQILNNAGDIAETGNGDGIIEVSTTANNEDWHAWQQLSYSGIAPQLISLDEVDSEFDDVSVITAGSNNRVRSSNGGAWIFGYVRENNIASNALILSGIPRTLSGFTPPVLFDVDELNSAADGLNSDELALTGSLTPADAFSLDSKSDDGSANTGKIIGLNPFQTTPATGAACQALTSVANGNTGMTENGYNTSISTNACGMAFLLEF